MGVIAQVKREDGAVAVTVAIVLVLLFLVTALVVDLGFTRSDARANQTHADFAALAAFSTELDATATDRCIRAVEYFAANAPEVTEDPNLDPCDEFPETCDPDDPVRVGPIVAGPYELYITHPVSDFDDAMVQSDQSVDLDRDGTPCDRLKTEVRRNRAYIFAPASGLFEGRSFGDAVVRQTLEGSFEDVATLIVLDPKRCNSLNIDGQGKIIVQNEYDAEGNVLTAGRINVDSDGTTSCGGSNRIVSPTANGVICSGVDGRDNETIEDIIEDNDCGDVLDGTMRVNGPDNVALPRYLPGGDRDEHLLANPVITNSRVTRQPIDHRYNCLGQNPVDETSSWYPTSAHGAQYPAGTPGPPIELCPFSGNRRPHINDLVQSTSGTMPSSFHSAPCDPGGPVTSHDYVYFDCDELPNVTIQADVIVLRGKSTGNLQSISVSTGQSVTVRPRNADSTILVVRTGDIDVSGKAQVAFDRTFVYLHNGVLKVTGAEGFNWVAPDVDGFDDQGAPTLCQLGPADVPHPSCFRNLAFWSNRSGAHSMAGGGEINVRGIFFVPNAPFNLSGSGSTDPQEEEGSPVEEALSLENAQFFAGRINASGGKGILMKPDRGVFEGTPEVGVALIR